MDNLPIFAKQEALQRVDQDLALYQELFDIIRADYPIWLQKIRAAIAAGLVKEVGELAHSMKGALGNLGGMRAHSAAQRIELQAKSGDLQGIERVVDDVDREVADYLAAVKEAFPEFA